MRLYVRHYKSFINENFKDRQGRIVTLEFANDYIIARDCGSESKVMTTEFEEICEIPTIILVRLRGGQSLIIPKDMIIELDYLKARLRELANHLKIKYVADEKWEWR